jgi:hypothetical protein
MGCRDAGENPDDEQNEIVFIYNTIIVFCEKKPHSLKLIESQAVEAEEKLRE